MIKIIILIIFLTTNTFACLCTGYMESSFASTGSQINSSLQEQLQSLKTLESSIKDANTSIQEQNEDLEKENNLLKDQDLRDVEIIFYLKQRLQIQ